MNGARASMRIVKNVVYISKYELMSAFFRTEEEENEVMADNINDILSSFFEEEARTRHNVSELPFNLDETKEVVQYMQNI